MLAYACIAFVAFGIGAIVGAFLMIALLTGMTAHVEKPRIVPINPTTESTSDTHYADGRYR